VTSHAPVPVFTLSPDGLVLVISRRVPGGILTTTLHRAEPFTTAAIALALRDTTRAARRMQPGQRNHARRYDTPAGVIWVHVMLGPPTWWAPRLKREPDGTVMAGWLRAAVAVRLEPAPLRAALSSAWWSW
jgi:hypothetical protein